MNQVSINQKVRCAEGEVLFCQHPSVSCDGPMRFSVFLPPQAERGPVPVLYWLSGLTCSEENFMIKAGAQRYAAEHGIMLVAPDTSPRDTGIPGENESWDFGSGAGFYVDATHEPWSKNYRMYSYVVDELPALINRTWSINPDRVAVSGHSMGGHGALVVGLRNPDTYRSISAFAPICAPMSCPWGVKAFSGYLGNDREAWSAYDACHLLTQADKVPPIYVDQGAEDGFLNEQLKPESLSAVCQERGVKASINIRAGYDHSYYFVSSFIGEHITWHAKHLS